jgi:hypothetical protein
VGERYVYRLTVKRASANPGTARGVTEHRYPANPTVMTAKTICRIRTTKCHFGTATRW